MVSGFSLAGPWYRVEAITAAARAGSAEWDFVAVLPAVLSAAQRGQPFVAGWLSRGGGAPLELVTNAGPLAHPAGAPGPPAAVDGSLGLLFPNGARGAPITDDWLAEAGRLTWTVCPGRPAPPLAADDKPDSAAGARTPSLFESALVTLMTRPFGWLVVAEPTGLLDAEVAELRTQLNVLRRYEEEASRFDVERAERRMAELDTYREAGLWSVRVLAGAADPAELRRIAPVLVGSVDLSRHPYRLSTGAAVHDLRAALAEPADGGPADGGPAGTGPAAGPPREAGAAGYEAAGAPRAPFPATAGALAALAGLPRREVPGLRVLDAGYFDVTSETGAGHAPCAHGGQPQEAGEIELGAILDGQDRPVGTFRVPLATLNRHAFVTGATGAGKSQTVRHLLEQLTQADLPWLAIEPAKSEYAAMAGRIEGIGQVTVINPSDPDAVPLSVNPLAPEPGYPVQAHIDMVRALFQAAFDAEEPFPQIMSQALQRVYEGCGWDVVTGGGVPGAHVAPAVPTLEQLQLAALSVVEEVGYGKDLQADVRGFVDVRLRSLRVGSAGRFFEGGHPADIGELLRRNVVLAIEDVANDEDKAFLMGTLIIRLVEHLRLRARRERAAQRPPALRHVLVIEEAHRLLRNRGEQRASSHAVELFAGMLAEIRAYGAGIVVAEQIPAKLVPDVVKNTALKVVHRLPASDDRQRVGAAMNLDEDQSRQVVSLEPGVAAVFADGMDRPLRVRVPLGEGREQVLSGPSPPISGRRSAACGRLCRDGPACSLLQIRQADLACGSAEEAWMRIWVETLVLAFVTDRELPAPPRRLRRRWASLSHRLSECLLATMIERAVTPRAAALRSCYEPALLMESAAAVAVPLLRGSPEHAGSRAGPSWVIPQLRWLHELERVFPVGGGPPDPFRHAPPLDFDLVGVDDWPGMRIGHRVRTLRAHPLSLELDHNRALAWNALVGVDQRSRFLEDIGAVVIGADRGTQLRQVAEAMRVAGWLDAVLSWPVRFITAYDDGDNVLEPYELEPGQLVPAVPGPPVGGPGGG
jgi:uncharacterized protein